MGRRTKLWVVVLAGGEGTRVAHLTTNRRGQPVPKQFFRIHEHGSMLQWTLDRAARHADRTRVVALVSDAQRRWWEQQLHPLLPENILSQPENRGTSVALLHATVHVLRHEPGARILVLPSDHYVADERALDEAIERAVEHARTSPEKLVLLGARPDLEDTEYGWIVPAPGSAGEPTPVERFVEKPPLDEARSCLERGGVWNTFVLAFTGWALIHAFQRVVPDLFNAYMSALDGGRLDAYLARRAYADMPSYDFGRDVLEKMTASLRLIRLPACGWTDLGTPSRMERWLAERSGPAPA
ncbi:MAG TPA: sugar phosphate nucleotidyltransferase [Terriglobales bacterium]|nr:sugar phosphate nucleotidyltransferase [Terriglobales bacterium]